MKRATWILILAGLLTGGLGLQLIVTQPLHRQIDTLTAQVGELQSGLRLLADLRDDVEGTNDLLSGLEIQSLRLDQARTALENVRRLEEEVHLRSDAATEALASLTQIARVESAVIAQSRRLDEMNATLDQFARHQRRVEALAASATDQLDSMDRAEESLERLETFHGRIVAESDGIDIAETRFTRLIGLQKSVARINQTDIDVAQFRLDEIARLQQALIDDGQQTAAAREVSQQLIALQDELAAQGTRADIARKRASQLLNLEETLAREGRNEIEAATRNLATLLEMEERLAAQDGQLSRAVESLELMQDLQDEFHRRTQDLESIRRGLTELIMMESLVARTVRSLKPLAELADLRRLDVDQIRSIAQSLLDQQAERTATNDPKGGVRSNSEVSPTEKELVPLPQPLE